MVEPVSELVVLQRVRNRIIEVLELFSDDNAFDVARSNLEFWEDWVNPDKIETYVSPVFTQAERIEIQKVCKAWDNVDINSPQESEEWLCLSRTSEKSLKVFNHRGKFSED